MEKYSKLIYSNKFISIEDSVKKQEIWRQKQIFMLFKSGRPIFNKYIKNKYDTFIIYNNLW
jgi:hypothetical protein